MTERPESEDRVPEFDRAVHEYYQSIESGKRVEQQAFIDAHPGFKEELRSFFADLNGLVDAFGTHNSAGTDGADQTVAHRRAAAIPRPGTALRYVGEYEIIEEIARGGMGIVFKARHGGLRRDVALKMILAGGFASQADVDRFHREACAAAALMHPNIVGVHEVGQHEGHHYFAMDFVDGKSLASLISDGTLAPRRTAELIQAVALAIDYAHENGVLHRDLKPANILIDKAGQPHITDFGLAKTLAGDATNIDLTATGQVLGTPSYMSPEQAAANHQLVSVASDIYSLGAILYACLSGRAPFVAESTMETLRQVIHNEPLPTRILNPHVPKDLETVCLKCLAKEPHRRYGTAADLASDLQRFQEGRPVIARPIGRLDKTYRWARRNPWIAATAVLLMLIGLASPLFAVRESNLRRVADHNAAFAADEAERANQEAALAKRRKQEAEANLDLANKNAEAERLAKVATNAALSRIKYFLALAHWDNGRVADAVAALEEVPEFDRHLEWNIAYREFQGSSATLKGHVGTVNAVLFSPDGKHVASGGSNEILIWDAGRGKTLRSIQVNGIVRCLRYSRDGTELYASSGNTITVWNPTTGQPLGAINEAASNNEEIWSFDLHPRKPVIVIGTRIVNEKGRLLWRNLADGALLRNIETPIQGVRHVCFSPEGSRLGSIGFFSGLAIWDSESGEPLWKLYRDAVDVAFSPDGTSVATSKTFMGWSIHGPASGEIIQQGPDANARKTRAAKRLTFNPSGTRLAIGYADGEISILRKSTERHSRYQGHRGGVTDMAFSPDGSMLASASEDGTVKLWDLDESRIFGAGKGIVKHSSLVRTFLEQVLINRAETPLNDRAMDATFGSSGRRLAVVGFDKDIQIWDTADMSLAQTISGHPDFVIRVAMSQDGTKLASACVDNSIHLWDLASGQIIQSMHDHRDLVTDLQFSPDGQRLISCDLAASVKVWSTVEGKEIHTLLGHHGPVQAIDVRGDGKNVASIGLDGTLHVWDIDSGNLLRKIEVGGKLYDVEFLPASPVVCVGGARGAKSGLLQWWDTSSGKHVRSIEDAGGVIHSLALNHDATRMLTCESNVVKLWDVEKKQELLSSHMSSQARKVLFCPTRELIVIARTAVFPGSGPFDLPMQVADLAIVRGADASTNLLPHDPIPDAGEPTRSEGDIDAFLTAALSSRDDLFAAIYALGSWLRQSDESNPNRAAALNWFHGAMTEWKSTLAEAYPEMSADDADLLLPDDARRVLAKYPNAADAKNGLATSGREDPGFESELVHWYEMEKHLDKAADLERKNEFSEARKIYQTLIDEAAQKTDDPLRVIAHVPYAVTLAWLWNQLADLEKRAGRPQASRAAREKLAEAMSQGIQKANPSDWLTLADLWFDIDRLEEAANAYLKHLQLVGKTELIPTDGKFCPHLRHADFRIVNRLMRSRKFKPAAIDGKVIDDMPVYRARFEPEDGKYYYYWGIDEASFQRRSAEIQAEGLTMVDHQSFQKNDGTHLHCAIWEFARPSPEQGRIEGEAFYQISCSGGATSAQDMTAFHASKWSGDKHLLWIDGAVGDHLEIGFKVEQPGRFDCSAVFTTASDYGIVDIFLDDQLVVESLDLFRRGDITTVNTVKQSLGTRQLAEGKHRIRVVVKGSHPDAVDYYGFGLDYVKFQPVTPAKAID